MVVLAWVGYGEGDDNLGIKALATCCTEVALRIEVQAISTGREDVFHIGGQQLAGTSIIVRCRCCKCDGGPIIDMVELNGKAAGWTTECEI